MKKFSKIVSAVAAVSILLGQGSISSIAVMAAEEETHGHGAILMTEEQREAFHRVTEEVVDMRLNAYALERIADGGKQTRSVNGMTPAELGKEAVTAKDLKLQENYASVYSNYILPPSADNSGNNTFPVINNQGQSESCTVWALGYYQATNNIALVRGKNAKTGVNAAENRISPKFIYNLINGGQNTGTFAMDAMNVLCSYGAPSWSDCPGATTATISNYRTWNPDAEVWESALQNKINRSTYITLDPEDTTSFDVIRKAILNGYVVSFSTNFDGWSYKTSKEPVKEQVCTSVNGNSGAHMLTIVGYDDTLWADINGNNVKDAGETGAFKIANSWGTGYKNDGYTWLSYDALKETSSITGANNRNREGAIWGDEVYFLEPKVTYQPSLVAELTMNTARRNQIGLEFGVSSVAETNPTLTRSAAEYVSYYDENVSFTNDNSIAFNKTMYGNGNNENYNFTSGMTAEDGTFSFDLTPLINEYFAQNTVDRSALKFYVLLTDETADGKATVLKSFKMHDRENNLTAISAQSNLSADGTTVTATVSYSAVAAPENLTAAVVNGALNISWDAVSGAAGYEVEINGDRYTTATNTYTRTAVTPGRLYHIRVRTKDLNTASDWGEYLNLSYCKYGDVNRDGRIDGSDMEIVYEKAMDNIELDSEQLILADVDGDGEITMMDVREITRYINNNVATGNIGVVTTFTNSNRAVKLLKYGDVNRDGEITQEDATQIMQHFMNPTTVPFDNEQFILADVDGNGIITNFDAIAAMKYVNTGEVFPVGTYAAFYAD